MNRILLDEKAIREIASRFGAYCEDGKPPVLDDLELARFANHVFNIGYDVGMRRANEETV
jgi:hypothetical protein